MTRLIVLLLSLFVAAQATASVRIKDIASIRGVRENQLVGYGLVVGLQGTGDTLRNSTFTEQSLQSMLDRMGISVRSGAMRTRNVAAVVVTAEAPPHTGFGSRLDVTVSSLGDASSLVGGTLVMTPLSGPNGVVYASAQGGISVSGFSEAGKSELLVQGVPTSGRIPNGAILERDLPESSVDDRQIVLELRNPDFRTAVHVADAINVFAKRRFGMRAAVEQDSRAVVVSRPGNVGAARFIADIGDLMVTPDVPARVVIDARSGTVVIGADVQISTVAITHGALSVRITETPTVSQPAPRSLGTTTVTSQTNIEANQGGGQFSVITGASIERVQKAGLPAGR